MKISDKFKFGLLNISFLLMFSMPLFPTNIKPVVIGLLGVAVLISNYGEKLRFNKRLFLTNGGIYLLLALSMLYSDNMEFGIRKLETMSSLIIFPLIFSILPTFSEKNINEKRHWYLFAFFLATVIFNIASFLYHFGHYKESLFKHYPTVIRIAQAPYNIHPIYISAHICVAILFSFFILKKLKTTPQKAVIIILDLILLIFLFILLRKGPIIVLGMVSLLFVLFQKSKKLLLVGFIVIMLNIVVIVSIPQYRVKFLELTKIENVEKGDVTSTNIRYSLFRSAIENILKSPIVGYGLGDHKDELLNGLKDKSDVLYQNRYNSHNQYLSFALSIGIVGLLYFIYFLGYNFALAIRYDNQVLILLILFYGLTMMFENILEREDGVIYFSFFISFFAFLSYNEHNAETTTRRP